VALLQVVEDLAQAEQAHRDRHEVQAVGQVEVAKVNRSAAGEQCRGAPCEQQPSAAAMRP
jgi:hypothetical protein